MKTTINLNVTFEMDMVDTWKIKTPQQLQEEKAKEFRKEINRELDKMGLYNPFTLKAVVNGKGEVKILLYNIDRYKKETILDAFEMINKLYKDNF